MRNLISIFFLLFSVSSFSGEDPRKQAYLDYLEKNGYQEAMQGIADKLSKSLPIKADAATTTYAILFYGTQLTYKSYFDLDALNKAYKTNLAKSDISTASEERRYIQGRIDSTCRNDALRPAIKMGMHVTDIMNWFDTNTQLYRAEIFENDCKNAGL